MTCLFVYVWITAQLYTVPLCYDEPPVGRVDSEIAMRVG